MLQLSVIYISVFQGDVDSHTIDEYIELEKEIASHEAKSPALILQQKNNQMLHLEERIKQQEENVEALDEQTWVWISNAHVAMFSSLVIFNSLVIMVNL